MNSEILNQAMPSTTAGRMAVKIVAGTYFTTNRMIFVDDEQSNFLPTLFFFEKQTTSHVTKTADRQKQSAAQNLKMHFLLLLYSYF